MKWFMLIHMHDLKDDKKEEQNLVLKVLCVCVFRFVFWKSFPLSAFRITNLKG